MSQKWVFGIAANVIGAHMGNDGNVYYGTKALTPGTKVYINGKINADAELTLQDEVAVIGQNRFKHYTYEWVAIRLLENFRVTRIYTPKVMDKMWQDESMEGSAWYSNHFADHKACRRFVKKLKELGEQEH